jgi:hypothetical protein
MRTSLDRLTPFLSQLRDRWPVGRSLSSGVGGLFSVLRGLRTPRSMVDEPLCWVASRVPDILVISHLGCCALALVSDFFSEGCDYVHYAEPYSYSV